MRQTLKYVAFAMVVSIMALGAKEGLDRSGSSFPAWFDKGIYVGTPASLVDQDTKHRIKVMKVCDLIDLDIPAAAASVMSFVTGTCTGVAVGDQIISVTPMQDDAAWDEGNLGAFVESANTVKVQYNADTTGGDPAATNDYKILYIQH